MRILKAYFAKPGRKKAPKTRPGHKPGAETGGFVEAAVAGRVRQHPDGSSGCHLELARLDIEERREADCCQRNCIGPSRQGEVLGGDNRNSATALYPCLGLPA